MFAFVCVLTVIVIYLLCKLMWKKRKFSKMAEYFKQDVIKSYPILGVSYIFIGNNEYQWKVLERFGRITNEYKGGCGILGDWFGPRYFIFVSDPIIAEFLMRTCLEKDDLYKVFKHIAGNGNIFAPIPIWRHRRKNLVPIFRTKGLNEIVPVFIRNSEVLAEKLKGNDGKEPFPLWDYLTNCNMDSVCESVLGVKLHTQKNPENAFLKAVNEIMKLTSDRILQPWLHSDLVYKLVPQYRRVMKARKVVIDSINQIIEGKREEAKNNNLKYDTKTTKTFLEQFIESSGYSDEELYEESLVIVVAATDTTSIATGFTMLLLAKHPDVQEKVYEELQEVFGDTNRAIESQDLPKLKYLEAVIKESLRLYPPTPAVLRKVTKDVTLPSGGTLVAGCGIVINIWAVHQNTAYWGPDADQFRPERFSNAVLKHPSQYMPFSFGPRNCPGVQYAMLSLKTTMATILRRYRVLPPSEEDQLKPIQCSYEILLKEVHNFTIRLSSRKNK